MKVAVLGPQGTFTHQAAERYMDDIEPVFCSSVSECLEHDTAFIPFENSIEGGVTESIDLLREKRKRITGEFSMPIEHVLATGSEQDNVETAVSHPQALAQCRGRLEELGLGRIESSSTASAAAEISEGQAAVCSELAADIHGLEVLERGIQESDTNETRFLLIDGPETEPEKTSLFVEPSGDRPGLLESILSCLSGHGINLSYVQSRPMGDGMGSYFFYLEAEAPEDSTEFQDALRCIETYASVKVAGSYS